MAINDDLREVIALTNLDNFVEHVNHWISLTETNMKFYGRRGKIAVWIDGNQVIVAHSVTSTRVYAQVPRWLYFKIIDFLKEDRDIDASKHALISKQAKLTSEQLFYLHRKFTPEEKAEWWLTEGEPNAPENEAVKNSGPLDSRKVIELLYWMFVSINDQPSTPIDLFWANARYKENWGLKGDLSAYSMGDTLHPDIPEILHELEASGYVLDTPQNMINSPLAGRFEEMEKRNGGRISRYPPFSFNLYISEPGFNHVLWSMRQGLLRDAIRETPGGRVIDWTMVDVVANKLPAKLPSLDLLMVPYRYKSSVVHFDMPDFVIWVARRSKNLPDFPIQEGSINLESLPVPWPIEDASLKILELKSRFRNLEGSPSVPYQTIIRFEINRIRGSKRTEENKKTKSPGYLVTIECYHQAVRPFFDELVREFEENWKDDAAAPPQSAGTNISNITSGHDTYNIFSNVAGGNQTTTTTTTTVTQQGSTSSAAAIPSTITPSIMTLAQFNKSLRELFSESDLKDVCLTLKIDYELLPGNSKADKTRELILELQRRGRVPELLTLVKQERPHISWPDTISD